MGTQQLKLRPSGLEKSADWNVAQRPNPWPKKSPSGALTAGRSVPSQNISKRSPRSIRGERSLIVIQMRRTVPLVFSAWARTFCSPALSAKQGEPLRPRLA